MSSVHGLLRIVLILLLSLLPGRSFAFTARDLVVSPSAINVGTVKVAAGDSATYAFTVSIAGGPIAVAPEVANFVVSTDASWLSLSASSLSASTGTVPTTLTATATVSTTMPEGTYSGSILVTSGLDPTESVSIPVQMTVSRTAANLLTVSPSALDVVIQAEGASSQTFPIRIANANPANPSYSWSAQTSDQWLSLSQTSGTGDSTISVTVDPTSLSQTSLILTGGTEPVIGTITFRSSLSATTSTLTVIAQLSQSTEFSVFPSQLFWSVEKSPDLGTISADALTAQSLQVFAGTSGWSATHNLSFATIEGELVSSKAQGILTVTPSASVLGGLGYGRYEGAITVSDRLNQFIRRIPVIVEIRRPGETASLPSQSQEISQISPYYSMVEVVEAGLLDLQLQVPRSLAYYPSQATCQAAGGSWINPDSSTANLNEYCSLSQRAYVLITLPEMFPGQVLAWTSKTPDRVVLVNLNGLALPNADSYSYADGPVPYIPFGPFQLLGFQGTATVSLRVGPTMATASEIQRIQLNIRNLTGSWRVTETYGGESYTYNDANLLDLSLNSATGSYSGSWGSSPVTVSVGDAGRTHFYRISLSEGGINYVYEVQSLTASEIKGRWLYSWSGGSSGWESFVAQRVVRSPFVLR